MIRLATADDIDAITLIYNDAILHTTATFDTDLKSRDEMLQWFNKHNEKYCVMIMEQDGKTAGWASLSQYSDRCAYDNTCEFSIYIHPDFRRKGLSKPLMKAVLEQGKKQGIHVVLSRITEGNEISVRLHEYFDFFMVGTMKEVGVKFDRLLDVDLMQKIL